MRETEEFWEEVLAQIETGQVIPVIGPELLQVVVEGRDIPLYEVLARRLLAKYGLSASIAGAQTEADIGHHGGRGAANRNH